MSMMLRRRKQKLSIESMMDDKSIRPAITCATTSTCAEVTKKRRKTLVRFASTKEEMESIHIIPSKEGGL
eukprot:CAMPEP_0204646140 /NCGR_PEP_ID=MMETSP0718-20130828/4096_1 /ASSEMBLY_ACC=CAM_ASM_000674 /TAXON_ID=230516 /ORGANISM="Chaetoceros curvisetus" /LENGTH=69 /DNA_ID=CAMNT_0051668301 /DNA_START=406 /DNA_END=615 /DNA_ORIENTATION=+